MYFFDCLLGVRVAFGEFLWGGVLIGVVVVVVVIVGVDELLIVLSALYFAAIAFFAEGEVEVVAFEADPVLVGVFGGAGGGVEVVDG